MGVSHHEIRGRLWDTQTVVAVVSPGLIRDSLLSTPPRCNQQGRGVFLLCAEAGGCEDAAGDTDTWQGVVDRFIYVYVVGGENEHWNAVGCLHHRH